MARTWFVRLAARRLTLPVSPSRFPALFEEKTETALLYAKHQESVRERSPEYRAQY